MTILLTNSRYGREYAKKEFLLNTLVYSQNFETDANEVFHRQDPS